MHNCLPLNVGDPSNKIVLVYSKKKSKNSRLIKKLLRVLKALTRIFGKRQICLIAILIMFCVAILHTDYSPDLYFINFGVSEDISCHYLNVGDSLQPIENVPSKSIFFHETSCRGHLTSRQACSVESAARAHPYRQINILFSGPVTEKNLNKGSLNTLKNFPNVKFFRVHLLEYVKGTPLEEFVRTGALNRTRWRIEYVADLMRYVTLYKWGGVYLDHDNLVAKSFEELGSNFAGLQTGQVSAGVLAFSMDPVGRIVANAALRDFEANYRGDVWGRTGPGVITRTMQKICRTQNLHEMTADRCKGFKLYGSEIFYPVRWRDAKQYFETDNLKVRDPYSYHVWNKLTSQYNVTKNCVYWRLAQKYCPTIHQLYGDRFGM